jgi:hypothetical protein
MKLTCKWRNEVKASSFNFDTLWLYENRLETCTCTGISRKDTPLVFVIMLLMAMLKPPHHQCVFVHCKTQSGILNMRVI